MLLLDSGSHVQDRGAICRLGDALRDGSRLLLRRLLGLCVSAAVPVASFPPTVLRHRLHLTKDGQEGHESETNGQHSAEDTSPQVNKKGLRIEVEGREEERGGNRIRKRGRPRHFPNDKIEQAKDKTNLNQWEHAATCH